MSHRLVALTAALAALALAGCTAVEDCPGTRCRATTDLDDSSIDDTGDSAPPPQPYRFARIDEYGAAIDTPDAGADIDAVILEKPDGSEFYAETVEGVQNASGFTDVLDPAKALAAPDAVVG